MLDKKGDYGFPFYFFPATTLLILTLVVFGIMFFVVEIGKSPNLVIKSEVYQDSSKLITILRSPTSVQQNGFNLSIAQLISLAYKNPTYKNKLSQELKFLLDRLPRIPKGEGLADVVIATPSATRETIKEANWNFDVEIENNNFLHIGQEPSLSTNYLNQSIIIPLENNKIAKVDLYLNCFLCKKEDVDFVS